MFIIGFVFIRIDAKFVHFNHNHLLNVEFWLWKKKNSKVNLKVNTTNNNNNKKTTYWYSIGSISFCILRSSPIDPDGNLARARRQLFVQISVRLDPHVGVGQRYRGEIARTRRLTNPNEQTHELDEIRLAERLIQQRVDHRCAEHVARRERLTHHVAHVVYVGHHVRVVVFVSNHL